MAEIEIGLLAQTCLDRRIGSVAEFQQNPETYGSTSSGDYSKKSDFPAWPTAAHTV